MVELTLPDPMEYLDRLSSFPYVKETSLHGSQIHVLLSHEKYVTQLGQDCGYIPERITPSLEDVFIHIARFRKEGGNS
jgi:ABC-2 type transport system ATP-binding protein